METFHKFGHLPFELRAMIWKMTAEPRIVDVRVRDEDLPSPRCKCGRRPWNAYPTSSAPIPAIVQTCREARNLGVYRQCFREISAQRGCDCTRRFSCTAQMIADWRQRFYQYKYEPIAHLIKRLRLERENDFWWFQFESHRHLWHFRNLQEAHLICKDSIENWELATEDFPFFCGPENLLLIDKNDGRRMLSNELDAIFRKKCWAYGTDEDCNTHDHSLDK
ncbi:hypothetical protein M011DRAFT_403210 [Sporormia fimetaria CBS 119925]|uniref:2EXR domain-containing protein n=1 Tax=Sporormia fimetaria CBS 119925 TaxID=1340428 RepID=A0A6A6V907_9PLEO|nr:hypothetical protein M011DRAFT_403210 [Sporormia fimetaria CBS 119925]